jgi:hypothetical protein
MRPPWRKALLTLHVASAVGWLGVDLVQLTLAVAGRTGTDPAMVYPALGFIGLTLFVPLSFVVWLVGVISSLATPWGLVKHWWVVAKLALTTIMLGLVWFQLRPNLIVAADSGGRVGPETQHNLMMAGIVSTTLLLIATILSTYKPWGRLAVRSDDRRDHRDGLTGPARRVPSRQAFR